MPKALLIAAILVGGHFVVHHLRDGYSFGAVVPPQRELEDVSKTLGNWQGVDLPVNTRIREILMARSGIDRMYRAADGREVVVHAVWTDDYLRLHFPQQCYREAGWEDRGSRDVIVTSTTGERFDAKIVGFSRDGQDVRVLYWFQLGDRVFLDRIQHRLARREKLWGEKEWPPLMKFMLETSDDGTGTADESLIDMAKQIYGDFFEPTSTTHTPVQPAGLRDMALPLSIHPPTSRLDAVS